MSIESMIPSNHLILCCPFFSYPQSFPALMSFPVSWLFTSGGQSIGALASASVVPMNIQGWFPFGLTVWSPCSPRDSQESSPTPQFKSLNSSALSFLYGPTPTWLLEKPQLWLWSKMISLLLNMLSRFVKAFLPRSKCLLISWLQSPSAVIFGAQENKGCHCFHCFPIYSP